MSTANTDIANANQARRAGKAGDLLNIIFDRAVASGLSIAPVDCTIRRYLTPRCRLHASAFTRYGST